MDIHFLTFASSNWKSASNRMKEQTDIIQNKYNFFKSVDISDEYSLPHYWYMKYCDFFGEQGFGLWSWKPYLIYHKILNIKEGDCLFYADGGCNFPLDNFENFSHNLCIHIDNTRKCELKIGIEPCLNTIYPNIMIIRRQILEKFGLEKDIFFLTKWLHYEAGILMIIKNKQTVDFIKQWVQFFDDHFEDSIYSKFTDRTGQYNGFVHNGSDQAVMQCMLYKNINRFYTILDNIYYKYGFYARKTEYNYLRP